MFDVENGWSSKISRWCLDFISATTCELTEAGNESGPGWLVRYNHQSVSIPIFTSLPISSRRCNTSLSDQQANDILQRNTNPNPKSQWLSRPRQDTISLPCKPEQPDKESARHENYLLIFFAGTHTTSGRSS